MNHLNVLIVEDESIVAMEIESYISSIGCKVTDIVSSAEEAYLSVKEQLPDLILMDIYLEGSIDGIETAAVIKEKFPQIEVIFLSANKDVYNIDRAITIDPVSYLSKPFHRQELLAALKLAKHKFNKDEVTLEPSEVQIQLDHEFVFDLHTHMLYCCNEFIHLTKKEALLLELFIENKNRIVDFESMESRVWEESYVTSNTVRTLIRRLRSKLKQRFIETLSTQGYIFNIQKNKEQSQ